MSSHIDRVEVDKAEPDSAKARELLRSLIQEVEPILKSRSWSVKRFVEINREKHKREPRLLGRNTYSIPKDHRTSNRIEILLRRFPDGGFRSKASLMKTMIHELSHIAVGPHNSKFYQMMDELTAEWQRHQSQGHVLDGKGFPTSGIGHRLGGKRQQLSQRELAAWAAERRRADAEDGFDEDELCPGLADALKESLEVPQRRKRAASTPSEETQLTEARRRSMNDHRCVPCNPLGQLVDMEEQELAVALASSLAHCNPESELERAIRMSQSEALERVELDTALAASIMQQGC